MAKLGKTNSEKEMHDFGAVFTKIKNETENNRDDKMTAFPEDLSDEIKTYAAALAGLEKGIEMSDDDNKAAIARN